MGIKILAGTDFHGFKPAFELFAEKVKTFKADIMVICGDITNFGTIEQAKNLLSILAKTGAPIFFVPGNCDPPSLININLEGVRCVHGNSVLYNNLVFMGVGGSPITPFNTFFEMSEEKIAEVLQECLHKFGGETKKHKMILLSHSPPKNTALDRAFSGIHAGSTSVRGFIEEHKPLLVVCGHIHEAKGKERVGDTLIINPGPARQGNCAVISIEGDEVNADFYSIKM
ncbi:MAG: metallophosphoesterase [Candidatus Bathyarchaeia archaeon]